MKLRPFPIIQRFKALLRFSLALSSFLFSLSLKAAIYDIHGNRLSDFEANSDKVNWTRLSLAKSKALNAVGVLESPYLGDICTVSFIDSGHDAGPAYFISAAHCNFFSHWGKQSLDPNRIYENLSTDYYVTLNRYFDSTENDQVKVLFKKLIFISEHHTDVSLFESDLTQGQLKKRGFSPLKLATQRPKIGQTLDLIGVPLMYVPPWNRVLYSSQCEVLYATQLENGKFSLPESFAHRCASLPGFSGGPLINTATQEIFLINSHGTDQVSSLWAKDCEYAARACEVKADGRKVVNEDVSYGQPVYHLSSCFGADGRFNLKRPRCLPEEL